MGWAWEKLRGVEAMGLGDVKMMFMVGAYLGWRLTILTIFLWRSFRFAYRNRN